MRNAAEQGVDTPKKRGRLRRALRVGLRAATLGLAFLLLFLLLLPWITNAGPVRALVGHVAAGFLRGADVRFDALRVAPFRPEVFSMEGLRISPEGRPQDTILTLGRVSVHWDPADLIHRRLHLTTVDVDSVRLNARKEAGGWNVTHMMTKPGQPLTMDDLNLPVGIRVDSLNVRGVQLSADAGGGLKAGVQGLSAEASCSLSGFIQGSVTGDVRADSIAVETPFGSVRLDQGLAARASVENSSKTPHLSGTLTVPQVVAQARGFSATKPLPFGAAFEADVDLAALELPRLEAACHVPGLAGDELTLSVRGGPDYRLSLHNSAAGDLAALVRALPPLAGGPVGSLDAGGRALAVADLDATVSLKPHPHAYALLRQSVYAADVRASTALKPAALRADVAGLHARAHQEVAIAYDGALGGLSVTDVSGGLGSGRVEAGEQGAGGLDGLDFGLTARAALPTAGRVELAAHAAGGATGESAMTGKLSLPVAGTLRLTGTDLLGPDADGGLDASGSAGVLLPGASLHASVSRAGAAAVRGCGAVDVGRVIGIVKALPLLARLPVESLDGAGTAGAVFDADALVHGGLAASCVGAAELTDLGAGVKGLAAGVGRLEPAFAMDVTAGAGFLPRALRTSGAVHAESISATRGIALGGMDATADVDWSSSAPSVLHAVKEATLTDISVLPGLPPLSLKAAGEVTADAVVGDLTASKVQLSLGDLLTASAPELKLTGFGAGLSGSAHADVPDLGKVVAFASGALPAPLRAKLPTVSGKASGEVELGGGLPLAERTLAGLLHGRLPAMPTFFPLAAFYRDNVPLTAKAHLTAADVTVLERLSDTVEAGVRGLSADATVDLSAAGDLTAAVQTALPEAVFTPSPVPLKEFGAEGQVSLTGFDALTLSGDVSALGGTLTSKGALSLSGLSRLPLPPGPADALRTLSLSAHAEGALKPGELKVVEGLESSGEMGGTLDASLEPGRELQVAVAPHMSDFSASFRDLFSLQGLNGGFTYARRWTIAEAVVAGEGARLSQRLIQRPPEAAGPGIEQVLPEFGTAVDALVDHFQGFSIASLSALGAQAVEGLRARLEARGSTFGVPQFSMRLLGGRTVGMAAFVPARGGRELSAQGEFAQVDFRRLLPPDLQDFSGDSRVSGTFAFSALLGSPTSTSPLKDVSARLDVTHIGSVALSRLLLALDPRSVNPSFVRLRQALSLAGPRSVRGRLQRGFVSGSAELQGAAGSLVSEYAIPPFNIAGLFGMKQVDDALRKAAPAMKALDLLDAERIELTPEGGVRLR